MFFENFPAIEASPAFTDIDKQLFGAVIRKAEEFFLAVTNLSARNFKPVACSFLVSLNHSQLTSFGN